MTPARAAAAFLCSLLPVSPDPARAEVPVTLELVLAVDSSASVDDQEFALQMGGIADAFRSPDVIELIGAQDGVAVALIQWAGWAGLERMVPWRVLTDRESIMAFADEVAAAPRMNVGDVTAIGTAIDAAAGLIARNGFAGRRLTIDISGDGQSNAGVPLLPARQRARHLGITINGLAILTDVPNLDVYFEHQVIEGDNAFVIRSADYGGVAAAMHLKLLRELAPAGVAALGPAAPPLIDRSKRIP